MIAHLVRHGAHDWLAKGIAGRMPGVHLNDQGVREANALGAWFAKKRLDLVVASPLERAQETAAALGRPIETAPAFQELDFGEWTGKTFRELHPDPRWTRFNTLRAFVRAPGGETLVEAQARVVGLLIGLYDRFPEGEVALFGHGDPIRTALLYATGAPLDFYHRFTVDTGSVSSLEIKEHEVRVLQSNFVPLFA